MAFDALKKYMEEQGTLEAAEKEVYGDNLYKALDEEADVKPVTEADNTDTEDRIKDDDEKTEDELEAEWYEVLLGTHF